jgi:peptidoglycan/LPS O-acetylase OafA/YrhL
MRYLLVVFVLWGGVASAQDLPTVTFAVAASADWVTTYRHMPHAREDNPLLRWIDHKPATMVALGASLDVATVYGWKTLTRNHRKWQAVGLYSAAAVRAFLAVRNTRRLHRITSSRSN